MRPRSLAERLALIQVLVILVVAGAAALAALIVAPATFHDHMGMAHDQDPASQVAHAEAAFRAAGLTALGIGIAVASIVAIPLSLVLTRGIRRGLTDLSEGASRVAGGVYDVPVTTAAGRELDTVAGAFNDMARQVATTEKTRRSLLTDLAHELRTPLAALDITLQGIEDGVVTLDAPTTATMREQLTRLTRLASDIRDVSEAEEGRVRLDMAEVSVAEVIGGSLAAAEARYAARTVSLSGRVQEGLTVHGDASRLGQVLDNLLANALRHTPAGGTVTVTAQRVDESVQITVTDSGEGIAAEDLPHVFERFFRADRGRSHAEGAGTGVGLPISRAIITAHGGTLVASSEGLGRGAVLTVTLPA